MVRACLEDKRREEAVRAIRTGQRVLAEQQESMSEGVKVLKENNELWKKVETLENANRTLLQQLQKLQTLVTSKISRPYKMAATQTGTCLMVAALCFVLVIGSLVPCLPEFSSSPHTAEEHATADSVYTDSQMPSRSLLFYDEAPSSWEDGRGALLPVEPPEGWEIKPGGAAEQRPQDPLKHNHQDSTHETTKYLGEAWPKDLGANSSSPDFSHPKEWLRERDLGPNTTVQLS